MTPATLTLACLVANAKYRRELLKAGPRVCAYCGRTIGYKTATLDHIVPRARGGADGPENLTLSCKRCNQAKGCRTPIEWALDILRGGVPPKAA
jgi:5-methylcytosine-specific restriction endonuclease McrA